MISSSLLLLLLALLGLVSLIEGSQDWKTGGGCLYVSRQKDGQVLIYDTEHVDEHGDHFDPIGALETNPNPTGIAFHPHKGFIYVGSYGRMPSKRHPEKIAPTIQIFDSKTLKKLGDFSSASASASSAASTQLEEEIKKCYPESVIYYQGYLYVSCGVTGRGILKIEAEKKFLKAKIAESEIPLSWGLTTKDNYLYISSHCHEHDDAGEGITDFCEKAKHDAVFRVDLNSESLTPELFALAPADEVGGFGDLVFADDGTLLVISFHSNCIFRFSVTGEFMEKITPDGLEHPIGIAFRDHLAYYASPGRGEISQYDLKKHRQDLFAHPGPILNSRLSYLIWARCPQRKRDEL